MSRIAAIPTFSKCTQRLSVPAGGKLLNVEYDDGIWYFNYLASDSLEEEIRDYKVFTRLTHVDNLSGYRFVGKIKDDNRDYFIFEKKPTFKVLPLYEDATIPSYAKNDDAGLDLFAYLKAIPTIERKMVGWDYYNPDTETIVIPPRRKALIPTGVAFGLLPGHVGLIWPRSGLASKPGQTIDILAGVIDAEFIGHVHSNLYNLDEEPITIQHGQACAQMVIQEKVTAKLEIVKQLDETNRGAGGFGHTER